MPTKIAGTVRRPESKDGLRTQFDAVVLWRRHNKLSREKASRVLGINPHTLRAYEEGDYAVPETVAAKVRKIITTKT